MELRNWRLFRVHQLHIKLGSGGNPLVGQQTWSSFEKTLYLHFIRSLATSKPHQPEPNQADQQTMMLKVRVSAHPVSELT